LLIISSSISDCEDTATADVASSQKLLEEDDASGDSDFILRYFFSLLKQEKR
jgi:hypothetical protein